MLVCGGHTLRSCLSGIRCLVVGAKNLSTRRKTVKTFIYLFKKDSAEALVNFVEYFSILSVLGRGVGRTGPTDGAGEKNDRGRTRRRNARELGATQPLPHTRPAHRKKEKKDRRNKSRERSDKNRPRIQLSISVSILGVLPGAFAD